MNSVRSIVTLGILSGMGLAIILNADKAAVAIGAVSDALLGLIRTASGTDPGQQMLK